MAISWRIYYDDDTTFDASQGTPEDAPAVGVICIAQYRHDGLRFVAQGKDWYFWHRPTSQWWPADLSGVLDNFMHKSKEVSALKQGRSVADERFSQIVKRAVEDKDFLK